MSVFWIVVAVVVGLVVGAALMWFLFNWAAGQTVGRGLGW